MLNLTQLQRQGHKTMLLPTQKCLQLLSWKIKLRCISIPFLWGMVQGFTILVCAIVWTENTFLLSSILQLTKVVTHCGQLCTYHPHTHTHYNLIVDEPQLSYQGKLSCPSQCHICINQATTYISNQVTICISG